MSYSRPQLKLLFLLAAVFLVGLGVREWRMGFPDAAERLERFDPGGPAPPPIPPAPRPRAAPRWAAVARPGPRAARALPAAADARERRTARAGRGPPARSTSTGPARTKSPGCPASARASLAASSRSAIGAGASRIAGRPAGHPGPRARRSCAALREHVTVGD